MSSCVLSHVWTLQANRFASCVRSDSPRAAHIDRMATAERMTSASKLTTVQLLLPNNRLLARSALTTLCSRRSSGSDASSCTPPSQKHHSRSAALWKHCTCSSIPLQKSCFISPLQNESASAPFHHSTSPASRRSLRVRSCSLRRTPQRQARLRTARTSLTPFASCLSCVLSLRCWWWEETRAIS